MLGNNNIIQKWKNLYKLPDDSLSIENAIIMTQTKRYTLNIDPQLIANNFIKRLCLDFNKELFKIVKPTDEKISSELELAIK